jgi:hypothetical protein
MTTVGDVDGRVAGFGANQGKGRSKYLPVKLASQHSEQKIKANPQPGATGRAVGQRGRTDGETGGGVGRAPDGGIAEKAAAKCQR